MASPDGTSGPTSPPGVAPFLRAWKIALARLRFVGVFAAVFVVVGGWETLSGYWARLTSVATSTATISSDTEYFCPMDPGVLSDWPSKCPICNMTLVRHKRGESTPLPDGVFARMQFTPYRLWLGGIRAGSIDYAPLAREVEAPGTVATVSLDRAEVVAHFFGSELAWVVAGESAAVRPLGGRSSIPLTARVKDVPPGPVASGESGRVVVEVAGGMDGLRVGDHVRVGVRFPIERIEPFRSRPTVPPPLVPGEPRRLYSCMEHANVVRDTPGRCPREGAGLMARGLDANQRVRWWCPMHPEVTADRLGSTCEACGGMVLVPRVVSYRPPGKVLGVPSSAVIEDGSRTLVYVETGAGMFDARAVLLGPRCGDQFPVIGGLEPGERVAVQGAFLIDAETRLNPSLAAGYFGAGGGASGRTGATPPSSPASEGDGLQGLAPADRPRALRQKTCPVTGKPLGSMGVPPKIAVQGRTVFLCCDGCTAAVEASPAEYLAKMPREDAEARP